MEQKNGNQEKKKTLKNGKILVGKMLTLKLDIQS